MYHFSRIEDVFYALFAHYDDNIVGMYLPEKNNNYKVAFFDGNKLVQLYECHFELEIQSNGDVYRCKFNSYVHPDITSIDPVEVKEIRERGYWLS